MNPAREFQTERVGDTLVIVPGAAVGSLSGNDLIDQRRMLVDQIRSSAVGSVVVDFAKVEYFGSFLLDTLCVVWKEIRQRSGNMSLCHLSEVSAEILDRSRLNRLWANHDSRRAAINAVRHEAIPQPVGAGGSNGSM
jgi:anti-anti-sigma factor